MLIADLSEFVYIGENNYFQSLILNQSSLKKNVSCLLYTFVLLVFVDQFGAYEEGDVIHLDMVTYDDASIYTVVTTTDSLMSEVGYFRICGVEM